VISVDVPGRGRLELEHLLLDVNGTLTHRGSLVEGVAERLARVRSVLEPRLVSADTFGALSALAETLGIEAVLAVDSAAKVAVLERLGPSRCAVVGNGANDAAALRAAGLGVAVVGPEGASTEALLAADVICGSILDALDLLLDERALIATLRR
jgi:soluble P-type ATPase